MKNHLNWIEIWRIRRQVAQCCAASLDCLLYADGFVERDVVDHHHIPAFERGNQTLFDISKEGLSVHGSLDNHGRDDPGLTEASNERHCFTMSDRNMADQALSAGAPAIRSHHIGAHCSFVDKYEAGGVKQPLLAHPASPRPNHVVSLALHGYAAFFNGDVMASEETGECATTCRDAQLTQNPNHLIQSKIRLLRDQSEDSLRVLLQRRNAPSARHRLRSSVVAKALKPPDCRTNADVELFGRLSSSSARFHEVNNPHSQRARIGSPHRSSPHRIKRAKTRRFGASCESPDSPRSGHAIVRRLRGASRKRIFDILRA